MKCDSDSMTVQTERALVPADSLANRLVLVRRELGLSQREAAQRCGVGFGSWQSWENGSAPRNALRDLVLVAQQLNIDRDWLLFGGPLRAEEQVELPPPPSLPLPGGRQHDSAKDAILRHRKHIDIDVAIPLRRPRELEAAA
jgi:transcriptional regulator with XRE-family HTH domain